MKTRQWKSRNEQAHKEKSASLILLLRLLLQLDSDWMEECLVYLCGFLSVLIMVESVFP